MKSASLLASTLLILALPLQAGPGEAVYNSQVQTTELLKTTQNAAGQDIVYPSTAHPQVTGLKVKIPAGSETGWHSHTVPGYAYVLSGSLTLQYDTGLPRVFKAGEAFVEASGILHNGRNQGAEDVVLVVFFTGEVGSAFTLKPATTGIRAK